MNDVKTLGLIAAGLMLLQACSPQVPASNAGPGFNDYADYELERARRDAGDWIARSPLLAQDGEHLLRRKVLGTYGEALGLGDVG